MTSPVIHTTHLFPILDEKLIALLRSLTREEWEHRTLAKRWCVKDVAAHLLDGNLRTLSMWRDQYFGDSPTNIDSHSSLVQYLNQLNADWVKALMRLSPGVLIDLLETTGKEYCDHLLTADLHAPAIFPVGWAGEEKSETWFHIAREYTEKWHHQQQIREAVKKPGIESRELYQPVLETFMRALPYHFGKIDAPSGSVVSVTIEGEAGGMWTIIRSKDWQFTNTLAQPTTSIHIHQDHAWKLLTNGLSLDDAIAVTKITGNIAIGHHFLTMLSVMA